MALPEDNDGTLESKHVIFSHTRIHDEYQLSLAWMLARDQACRLHRYLVVYSGPLVVGKDLKFCTSSASEALFTASHVLIFSPL
jgi:hypothetical protein